MTEKGPPAHDDRRDIVEPVVPHVTKQRSELGRRPIRPRIVRKCAAAVEGHVHVRRDLPHPLVLRAVLYLLPRCSSSGSPGGPVEATAVSSLGAATARRASSMSRPKRAKAAAPSETTTPIASLKLSALRSCPRGPCGGSGNLKA